MNSTTTDIERHDQLLDDPLYRRYVKRVHDTDAVGDEFDNLNGDEEADDSCYDEGEGDY